MGRVGRARYGTGFAGSETYSSKLKPPFVSLAASLSAGASKPSFKPALRYNGVARMLHTAALEQPDGHAGRRCQVFVPVSNAVTGATPEAGASSFKYWSRNGSKISR